MHPVEHPLLALPPGRRERTILATCSSLSRLHDGERVELPFVEEAGSLLLLTDDDAARMLLGIGEGQFNLQLPGGLGSVSLNGDFWPVSVAVARQVLEQVREGHRGCAACGGATATQLVGFHVGRVGFARPGRTAARVDLAAYLSDEPDWIVAGGIQLTEHLNTAHADEITRVGRQLVDGPEVLAATVQWIGGDGAMLSIITEHGVDQQWIPFAEPVRSPGLLSDAVHSAVAHLLTADD